MDNSVNPIRRVSPFLLMVIVIALILSFVSLYLAFDSFVNQTQSLDAYSFLIIGFGGLALSLYMLLQTKSKPMHDSMKMPRVITTLECPKCDFKNIRDFKMDDYIFKKVE